MGRAHLLVKENGILAGIELAQLIFEVDVHCYEPFFKDGDKINVGDIAFNVEGPSDLY